MFATIGAIVPVSIKQRFLSNRFWFVFVLISLSGTWIAYWLLYFWWENEARRSPNFPGLGGFLFLAVAVMVAGLISFVLGWIVPWQANRKYEPDFQFAEYEVPVNPPGSDRRCFLNFVGSRIPIIQSD